MTTLASVPHFDVDLLPPEDTMELASSPHMPQDDLDLDLDAMHEPEDALEVAMAEDDFDGGRLETMESFDDDEMVDGDAAGIHFPEHASDLHMETHQEPDTVIEDEDILYEDDELPKASEPTQTSYQSEAIDTEHNQLHEPLGSNSGDVDVADAQHEGEVRSVQLDTEEQSLDMSKSFVEVTESTLVQPQEGKHPNITQADDQVEEPDYADVETQANVQEHTIESGPDHEDLAANANPNPLLESAPDVPAVDQEPADRTPLHTEEHAAEQEVFLSESHDEALHMVRVIYQDNEICLFQPQNAETAETFFLSERSLAHESLDKLLSACRAVLADSIGDDDELVLDVASLGLHISEDSKHAAQITLSQILDVYLKLSHNDDLDSIEPLYCSLSSRVCLASQYTYLAAAAQEGRTITEIVAEHAGSPEFDAYEELPRHEEPTVAHETTSYEDIGKDLPVPEQFGQEHTDQTEVDATGDLDGRENDHSGAPASFDGLELVKAEDYQDTTGIEPQDEKEDLSFPNVVSEQAHVEDVGVQPGDTEYQEDINEGGSEDYEDTPEDRAQPIEELVESIGANDETPSSGTVEAEITDLQENDVRDFEQEDDHVEHFEDLEDIPVDDLNKAEEQHGTDFHTSEGEAKYDDPEEREEDEGDDDDESELLDLEPEVEKRSSTFQADATEEVEDRGIHELVDNDDLLDEGDASTDRTIQNNQGDQDDELDIYLLPDSPAKKRGAKRKAEADEEDEFDLLESETPEKKRTRPS